MTVYPPNSSSPLRGDLIARLVLRTDLTPIPATVELTVRRSEETQALMTEGAVVRVGPEQVEFALVKVAHTDESGRGGSAYVQGDRPLSVIAATGLLASCEPVARPLQRAVIRERTTLGAIYRACGAQVRIEGDFTAPQFSAFAGMTPSFEVAKVLQEEAGVLVYDAGRIGFRRLAELRDARATQSVRGDATERLASAFLERQAIPFGVSTSADNAFLVGRRGTARRAVYRPRADVRLLNNLGTALVMSRKLRNALSPGINAGARIDVDGEPHIVITAAHVLAWEQPGQQETYSLYWLGEVTA